MSRHIKKQTIYKLRIDTVNDEHCINFNGITQYHKGSSCGTCSICEDLFGDRQCANCDKLFIMLNGPARPAPVFCHDCKHLEPYYCTNF